jgi:hypothetical protein
MEQYMEKTNVIIFALVAVIFSFIACGEIGDPRFNGWAKYTDKEDGYTLFVPPDWSVSGFNIPGTRSSRFYNEIMYTGDRSAFVYFAVIVVDDNTPDSPLEKTGQQAIREFTTGIWKNFNLKTVDNKESKVSFRMSGEPYYSSYKLKGYVILHRAKGKLYYLMASGTSAAYEELRDTYEKIFSGFQP